MAKADETLGNAVRTTTRGSDLDILTVPEPAAKPP
jgi:hypothetical protein